MLREFEWLQRTAMTLKPECSAGGTVEMQNNLLNDRVIYWGVAGVCWYSETPLLQRNSSEVIGHDPKMCMIFCYSDDPPSKPHNPPTGFSYRPPRQPGTDHLTFTQRPPHYDEDDEETKESLKGSLEIKLVGQSHLTRDKWMWWTWLNNWGGVFQGTVASPHLDLSLSSS